MIDGKSPTQLLTVSQTDILYLGAVSLNCCLHESK